MTTDRFIRHPLSQAAGLAILVLCASPPVQAEPATSPAAAVQAQDVVFDIPAQPLEKAIFLFARQAGADLITGDAQLTGLGAPELRGRIEPAQALARLLAGSAIGHDYQPGHNGGRPRIRLYRLHDKTQGVLNLDATQISSRAQDDWVYETPRSVSVISREQLDRRPARHAADMLEQTAGVYSSVSQQDPALSVNIRGIQDYGRVNMNIDGMRQNFQKSGHGQRNGQMYIDPELLSAVTLDKGPSSGMGGAGVIGGVASCSTVNARDFLAPGKELGGKLSAGMGDNGTNFIGSSVFAVGNDVIDLLLGASERHLGDYYSGNKGDISGIRVSDLLSEADRKVFEDRVIGKVLYSSYTMRSRLAKLGLNLPDDQRVQLSYLQTQVSTPNAGNLSNSSPAWSYTGESDVMTRNLALDYSLRPQDNHWLDLKAKLYYVDTRDDTDTLTSSLDYRTKLRLQTYGLQLENTSLLLADDAHALSASYGLDLFHDQSSSESTRAATVGSTPAGKRSMGSLFVNLDYAYDSWLTLQGGLRYDRYRLRGETGFNSNRFPYTVDDPCTATRLSGCTPTSVVQQLYWDIDREEGKLSPTFAIGIKPGVDWLELFANYGKAWRPAATTETLSMGNAHSSYNAYPNPFLDPERSASWEVGVNTLHVGLLTHDDQLAAKLAWFDTRIDNYIFQGINRCKPGMNGCSVSNVAYVNNSAEMRFRGLEFQLNYDAGFVYGDLTWTRMIGDNDFCSVRRWLGGGTNTDGTRGNWYEVEVDDASATTCQSAQALTSTEQLPGDRASLTLGGRAFDRRLDAGLTVRYTPGYQSDLAPDCCGGYADSAIFNADWPSYTLFDLYASFKLTDNLTLRSAVENVTNRAYVVQYGDYLSYTLGRGRTVQGTLEYTF